MTTDPPLLEIDGLEKHFEESTNVFDVLMRREPSKIQAVDGVSFTLERNDSIAVIGESGCGKTTLLLTLIGLHDITGGDVMYKGTPMSSFDKRDWKEYRSNVQVIFQDPFNSLDPKMTVEESLREPLEIHGIGNRDERVREVLEDVELRPPEKYLRRKPMNLSGGEKQRVAIGRALMLEPDIILADEPVSMLDVSTQASVLRMLKGLIDDYDASMIYISHDLSTVSYISEVVNVMYLGRIVESAATGRLLDNPKHPYTEALVSAIPVPDPHYDRPRTEMSGAPRDPIDLGEGCRFRDRCPEVIPPDGIDIDQSAYREVMAFREALERDELPLDRIRKSLDNPSDTDAFATAIGDEHFSAEMSGENAVTVDAALEDIAAGKPDAAIDRLSKRFESVCELTPDSIEDESGWHVACHQYYDHDRQPTEDHAITTD
ncbi:ABC transporter ATP-binding protein [Halorubrum sp. BV1]|uniref:oligopeptide/dipeptide ABC transporter ATP-binding protein n=1 Tax=Halorubrum sp. BV1 TaxID=1498500 RepID=UPI0006797D74|nr:ABC transporter ATP-binding protein [Halorubrum sp. BV1]